MSDAQSKPRNINGKVALSIRHPMRCGLKIKSLNREMPFS